MSEERRKRISAERRERFCALYEQNRPRIVAYAMRRCPSREDATDLVAETFLIAWRRLDDLPTGEGALLWLYATASLTSFRILRDGAAGGRRSSCG